jgi:hypothetical protein
LKALLTSVRGDPVHERGQYLGQVQELAGRPATGRLFVQNWTICVRSARLREGAAADPYSAIRRWDRIAPALHYVINPARWLATNIRRYVRHLDLQNELPERVPDRAFCAFVKSVAVCCGAPGR